MNNDCSSTTVTIAVVSVNDVPVANPDSYTTPEDTVLNGNVTTNDLPSGDGGNIWTVLINATHGVVVMSTNGKRKCTEEGKYVGRARVTYALSRGNRRAP